jgi:protein transport protein SEC24
VLNDLKWNIVRPQGMEAVMRVRCSQGVVVDNYIGAFCRQPANPTDVYLPAIDCDKAILCNVRTGRKLCVCVCVCVCVRVCVCVCVFLSVFM